MVSGASIFLVSIILLHQLFRLHLSKVWYTFFSFCDKQFKKTQLSKPINFIPKCYFHNMLPYIDLLSHPIYFESYFIQINFSNIRGIHIKVHNIYLFKSYHTFYVFFTYISLNATKGYETVNHQEF